MNIKPPGLHTMIEDKMMIKRFFFKSSDSSFQLQWLDVAVRLYLFKVFFFSGLTKIQSWDSTVNLFYDYNVPFLPAETAAAMAAAGELILPVLLLIGLFSRPAGIGLFILNAVALYSYSLQDYANMVGTADHLLWGFMLLVYVIFGASKFSLDHLVSRTRE